MPAARVISLERVEPFLSMTDLGRVGCVCTYTRSQLRGLLHDQGELNRIFEENVRLEDELEEHRYESFCDLFGEWSEYPSSPEEQSWTPTELILSREASPTPSGAPEPERITIADLAVWQAGRWQRR